MSAWPRRAPSRCSVLSTKLGEAVCGRRRRTPAHIRALPAASFQAARPTPSVTSRRRALRSPRGPGSWRAGCGISQARLVHEAGSSPSATAGRFLRTPRVAVGAHAPTGRVAQAEAEVVD